jgi:hypothetical protein
MGPLSDRIVARIRENHSWTIDQPTDPAGRGRRQKYDIFEGIPSDEEEPIATLRPGSGLVSQLGEQPYLAQFVNQPDN